MARVARANDLTLALEHALRYLAETFAAPVPPGVLANLAAAKKPFHERMAFRASMRRPNPARMLRVLWERHRRLGPASGSFVTYVQRHAGLERRSQLPGHVLRQLRAGRWRRAR